MRIAFISTMQGNAWGGSEELWFEAVKEAAKTSNEVLVSVGHWSESASKLDVLRSLGVKVYVQEFPRSLLRSTDITKRIVSKFKQIKNGTAGYTFLPIKEFKPDIICISQANTYDIVRFPHLNNFLVEQNIPYTIICHGHEDIPPADEFRSLIKMHFARANWVGFVAQSLIDSTERHLAIKINNALVIRNPVNLIDLSELPLDLPIKPVYFASVARIECYQKGQDILFEALSGNRWLNRDWRLSLFGQGPHVSYLQELAAHYGIQNKIRFLGQVSDIRKIWAEHHFLILSSRYEGTPLSLVEAMLCARPAIVTDIAGNCEWVEDEINGFVAAAPSAKYLSEALERAWEKRFQWKKFGIAARQKALTQYTTNPGAVLINLLTGTNY